MGRRDRRARSRRGRKWPRLRAQPAGHGRRGLTTPDIRAAAAGAGSGGAGADAARPQGSSLRVRRAIAKCVLGKARAADARERALRDWLRRIRQSASARLAGRPLASAGGDFCALGLGPRRYVRARLRRRGLCERRAVCGPSPRDGQRGARRQPDFGARSRPASARGAKNEPARNAGGELGRPSRAKTPDFEQSPEREVTSQRPLRTSCKVFFRAAVALLVVCSSISCSRREGAFTTANAEPAPVSISNPRSAPFALVELFTSEGCSSCPPADKNLARITEKAEREGLRGFTLSFHV